MAFLGLLHARISPQDDTCPICLQARTDHTIVLTAAGAVAGVYLADGSTWQPCIVPALVALGEDKIAGLSLAIWQDVMSNLVALGQEMKRAERLLAEQQQQISSAEQISDRLERRLAVTHALLVFLFERTTPDERGYLARHSFDNVALWEVLGLEPATGVTVDPEGGYAAPWAVTDTV